jgi:hypothetical protein
MASAPFAAAPDEYHDLLTRAAAGERGDVCARR